MHQVTDAGEVVDPLMQHDGSLGGLLGVELGARSAIVEACLQIWGVVRLDFYLEAVEARLWWLAFIEVAQPRRLAIKSSTIAGAYRRNQGWHTSAAPSTSLRSSATSKSQKERISRSVPAKRKFYDGCIVRAVGGPLVTHVYPEDPWVFCIRDVM